MNYLKWKENDFALLQATVNIIITRNNVHGRASGGARTHTHTYGQIIQLVASLLLFLPPSSTLQHFFSISLHYVWIQSFKQPPVIKF